MVYEPVSHIKSVVSLIVCYIFITLCQTQQRITNMNTFLVGEIVLGLGSVLIDLIFI